jgi:hypothetical protein
MPFPQLPLPCQLPTHLLPLLYGPFPCCIPSEPCTTVFDCTRAFRLGRRHHIDASPTQHVSAAAGSLDSEDQLCSAVWDPETTNSTTTTSPTPSLYTLATIFSTILCSSIPFTAFVTWCHPSSIGPGKPVSTVPFGTLASTPAPAPVPPVPVFDWDQDPRLANLSSALCALGWTPPC